MDPKVSPSLEPAVKTVKGVLHGLNEIKEKGGTPKSSEITRLQGRLSEVDAQYREGRFEISPGGAPLVSCLVFVEVVGFRRLMGAWRAMQ